MKKVTREAADAFEMRRNYKCGNTRVEVLNGDVFMYLHGNLIAKHVHDDGLYITNAGSVSIKTEPKKYQTMNQCEDNSRV